MKKINKEYHIKLCNIFIIKLKIINQQNSNIFCHKIFEKQL